MLNYILNDNHIFKPKKYYFLMQNYRLQIRISKKIFNIIKEHSQRKNCSYSNLIIDSLINYDGKFKISDKEIEEINREHIFFEVQQKRKKEVGEYWHIVNAEIKIQRFICCYSYIRKKGLKNINIVRCYIESELKLIRLLSPKIQELFKEQIEDLEKCLCNKVFLDDYCCNARNIGKELKELSYDEREK